MTNPRIFHLLHRSHRAVFRAADKALLARFGITAAQQAALMFLARNEGVTMSALAVAVGLKAAATSGLVDRMERNGFLERRVAPLDGRSFLLFLKPAGKQIVDDSKALITESNQQILKGFSQEECNQISEFLETVIKRANTLSGEKEIETEGQTK